MALNDIKVPLENAQGTFDETTLGVATISEKGLLSSFDKNKLDGIAAGAQVNVQSNWNEASNGSDAFIQNKPTLGGAAALNVGTTAGSVAAGDHTHTSGDIYDLAYYLYRGSYSDWNILADIGTIYPNLGRGDWMKVAGSTYILTTAPYGQQSSWTQVSVSASDITSGTLNSARLPPLGYELVIACSDETSDLVPSSVVPKVTFLAPCDITLTEVLLSVNTAPQGSYIEVDVRKNGDTIFALSGGEGIGIVANAKLGGTDFGPWNVVFVSTPSYIAKGDEITIYLRQVGTTAAGKGLKAYFIGTRA